MPPIDNFVEKFTEWGLEIGLSRLSSPLTRAEVVDLATEDFVPVNASRALYVGDAGDVKVDLLNLGTGIVFKEMPIGFYPLRVTKVYKIGTDADSMLLCD